VFIVPTTGLAADHSLAQTMRPNFFRFGFGAGVGIVPEKFD
jgi:hypothetical protein